MDALTRNELDKIERDLSFFKLYGQFPQAKELPRWQPSNETPSAMVEDRRNQQEGSNEYVLFDNAPLGDFSRHRGGMPAAMRERMPAYEPPVIRNQLMGR